MAIGAVGAMQRLIEITVAYASDRQAFGSPIGKFQAIRHHIAEMATKAEASRALTYKALRLAPSATPAWARSAAAPTRS